VTRTATRLRGLAATALTLLATPAVAEDVPLNVASTTVGEYHGDNQDADDTNDRYGILLERLHLTAVSGNLEVLTRVDGVRYIESPGPTYRDFAEVERLALSWRSDHWRLRLGDEYRQLGSGFLLALRNVDDAGHDIAIRGGSVEATYKHGGATVFAGRTNSANLDRLTQEYVQDVGDLVYGAEASANLGTVGTVTAMGLRVEPTESSVPGADDTTTAGGIHVDLPAAASWLTASAEASLFRRTVGVLDTDGTALFVSTVGMWGNASVTLEGLYADRAEIRGSLEGTARQGFRYSLPPTLERFDQDVEDSANARGGRVRVDYFFSDSGVAIHANQLVRQEGADEDSRKEQLHSYAGIEVPFDEDASKFSLSGGLRFEGRDDVRRLTARHVEADLTWAFRPRYSLIVHGLTEFKTKYAGFDEGDEGNPFVRANVIVSLDRSKLGSVGFEYGHDDEIETAGVAHDFFAGHLGWEVSEQVTLRSVIGSQRGGLKCVNGVCRKYPAFAGARLELIAAF
jgi:hypothetical protein